MTVNPQVGLAVFIGLVATIEDLAKREIPNWIPVTASIGGLAAAGYMAGWRGIGSSLLGLVLGFAAFLLFYVLGGMGGGDIKLMAGLGAILGSGRILEAALWTAGVGGVMAAVVVAAGLLRPARGNEPKHKKQYIPYAPAIAAGAWIALVPKG